MSGDQQTKTPLQKVGVFASSGRIGQAQVRQLLSRGYPTVAITRHPSMLARSEFRNATLKAADYNDCTSLINVLRNLDAAFFQLPSLASLHESAQQARNMCEAALEAKLKLLVINSTMWAPDFPPCGQPLYDHVRTVEDMFATSGLPVIIFRPVLFMDNLLTLFAKPAIIDEGVFRYCHRPGLEANWISMDDTALFMIEGLERPELIGRRFTIGGPERLKSEEVAAILSESLGRPIRHEYLPPREFGEAMFDRIGSALGPNKTAVADFFGSFYTFNNFARERPFEVEMESLLSQLPLALTTMRQWAKTQDWRSSRHDEIGSATG